MAKQSTPQAKLRALLKRQAKEEREIKKRLALAVRKIRSGRAEYLRPLQEQLRALLVERRDMARRHRAERMAAAAEVREAAAGIKMARAEWPRVLKRRADALAALAPGSSGARLATAQREVSHAATWLREESAASKARRQAAAVKQWGKRVTPAKAIAKLRGKRGQTPAEFRAQAEGTAESFIASHHPEMFGAWSNYLRTRKPFTEAKRREWVARARKGFEGADYWGEQEAETFMESIDPSDWAGRELSPDAIARMEWDAYLARNPTKVPEEWADFDEGEFQ